MSLFSALFMASCGGITEINVETESKNLGINFDLSRKNSLEEMESGVFDTFDSYENCLYENSRFADSVQGLIESFNGIIDDFESSGSSISGVELMNNPPREDDKLAVYLCGDLQSNAYAIYRSVFLSESFVEEVWKISRERDREDLFESALGFVLYHEIGHTILNHSEEKLINGDSAYEGSYEINFDLPQELEADQFAYEAMSLTGLNAEGSSLAEQAGL